MQDQKRQLEKAVLQAFLKEKLAEFGFAPDDEALRLLADYTQLSEREGPEAQEVRSALIKEAADGSVTASMFSLYNITQLSISDLIGFLLKEAQILTMGDQKKVQIALAILALAHDFWKALDKPLTESEARVLLAVHETDKKKKTFAVKDVQTAFKARFKTTITLKDVQRYLDGFVEMTIIRVEDPRQKLYSKRQRISLSR